MIGNGFNTQCLICKGAFGRLLVKVYDCKPGCAQKPQGFKGFARVILKRNLILPCPLNPAHIFFMEILDPRPKN